MVAWLLLQQDLLPGGYEKLGIIGLLLAAVIYLVRENRQKDRLLMEALMSVEQTPEVLKGLKDEIARLK